jgi:hypothetical protein
MAQTLSDCAARSCFSVTPRVFVSRPAVLSREQNAHFQEWLRHLELLNFDSVTLDRDSYDVPPWDQIRSAIKRADGLLVLGFRHLHVSEGVWRPGTIESRHAALWWATPWNHIEAGLGLMAGVPVLVAHEAGVTEGVFSRDAWGGDLYGVRLEASLEAASAIGPSSRDTSDAVVKAWARAVKDRVSTRATSPT